MVLKKGHSAVRKNHITSHHPGAQELRALLSFTRPPFHAISYWLLDAWRVPSDWHQTCWRRRERHSHLTGRCNQESIMREALGICASFLSMVCIYVLVCVRHHSPHEYPKVVWHATKENECGDVEVWHQTWIKEGGWQAPWVSQKPTKRQKLLARTPHVPAFTFTFTCPLALPLTAHTSLLDAHLAYRQLAGLTFKTILQAVLLNNYFSESLTFGKHWTWDISMSQQHPKLCLWSRTWSGKRTASAQWQWKQWGRRPPRQTEPSVESGIISSSIAIIAIQCHNICCVFDTNLSFSKMDVQNSPSQMPMEVAVQANSSRFIAVKIRIPG